MTKKRKSHGGGVSSGKKSGKVDDKEKGDSGSNPFERIWNRRKFDVLGKKVKGEQRKIGQSRSEAINKRKRTLLAEYKQSGKSSAFIDRRFGEDDEGMAEEDRAIMRYQKERMAQLSRKSRFTLEDDDDEDEGGNGEMLTHLGMAIDDYEDDGDTRNHEGDDFEGSLGREMVERLHFGGGFMPKKGLPNADQSDTPDRPKTKKEVMEEIIAKSKMHKAQRAKEKDEDEHLVEELDQQFREIQGTRALVLAKKSEKQAALRKRPDSELTLIEQDPDLKVPRAVVCERAKATASTKVDEADDYEKMTKELVFEMRAHASDRLKRPEEVAREEKQRLEALETKRQKRMRQDYEGDDKDEDGVSEGDDGNASGRKQQRRARQKKRTEASGDDLGENFVLEKQVQRLVLSDGKLRVDGEADEADADEDSRASSAEDSDGDGSSAEEDEDGDDDDEDAKEASSEEEKEEAREGDKEWEQDEDGIAAEMMDDGEGGTEARGVTVMKAGQRGKGKGQVALDADKGLKGNISTKPKPSAEDKAVMKIKMAVIASAKRELPFVIEAPKTLDEFRLLVDGRTIDELKVAIHRIRACNAITLAGDNRKKMQIFYGVLLQYFAAIAGNRPLPMDRIDALTQPLIEMSTSTPLFAAVCARERLMRMQRQLSARLQMPGLAESCFPTVRTLLLLRLWFIIFPPSDFEHPVCTPAMLIAAQYLMRCPVMSLRDVAIGTFLSSIMLSVCSQGKRFCPEAISFLHDLLRTGLPNADKDKQGKDSMGEATVRKPKSATELLVHTQPWLRLEVGSPSGSVMIDDDVEPLNFVAVLGSDDRDGSFLRSNRFRSSLMFAAVKCLHGFVRMHMNLSSFSEIFSPVLATLKELRHGAVPNAIDKAISDMEADIIKAINAQRSYRQPLRMRIKKPVPIKQFNPRFEDNFALGKDYDPDRERAERKKLQKTLKREAKGAARELRKDNYFMAEVKAKERAAAAEERDEKYKKAMSFLEAQESAFKSGQLGSKGGGKRRGGKKR